MSKETEPKGPPEISRREFLKGCGAAAGLIVLNLCIPKETKADLFEEIEPSETFNSKPSQPTLDSPEVFKKILPVKPDAQDFSLSCESSAAAMVASYFELNLPEGFESWEDYFVETIPPNCNPHRGFRGEINGHLSTSCNPPNGYGVYAEPIAEALRSIGLRAYVKYGVDYQSVRKAIERGWPVIVWMSGRDNPPIEKEVDPETGQFYSLVLGEHVLVVIGFEDEKFLVNDPWRGRQYWVSGFKNWELFDGMRVVVGPPSTNSKFRLLRNLLP